jgi:SAM-dependent methyltransferase
MSAVAYTHEYYQREKKLNVKFASGRVIMPLVIDLLHPRSVVDVGCGTGVWLSIFQEQGVTDCLGVDGEWARDVLLIPSRQFLGRDLTQPLVLDRSFDLAVSIEVAEHLPAACADLFVASLVAAAPRILFSAAIPFQGGTNHVNEQWQDYWAQRFLAKGYVPIHWIRHRIWQDERVASHLRQNLVLYVQKDIVEQDQRLAQEAALAAETPLTVVHPEQYTRFAREMDMYRRMKLFEIARVVPQRLWKRAKRQWRAR